MRSGEPSLLDLELVPAHSQAGSRVIVNAVQDVRAQLSQVLVQVFALQLDTQLHRLQHLHTTKSQ